MALSDRVKQRRAVLKLSQGEVARRSGVSQGLLSRIESGEIMPGGHALKALAITLHCSVDWLLEMYDDAPVDRSVHLLAASP